MVANEEVTISEAEAALYDRQIRLWGLDAQKRFVASTITEVASEMTTIFLNLDSGQLGYCLLDLED